jgi:hypothetical protein
METTGPPGRRLSVWVPGDKLWLFGVLDQMVKHLEGLGLPASLGRVVREVLEAGLEEKRRALGIAKEAAPEPRPVNAGLGRGCKRHIVFRRDDMDVLAALERIVRAKRASGFETSLSRELVRVARAGLLTGLEPPGAELDRAILAMEEDPC